jgi:5-methylcytosine-specific restriction endonuclease McrA
MSRSLSANGKLCSRRSGRSSNFVSKKKRLAIYLRDRFSCMYCGRDLHSAKPAEITLDHLECRNDNPSGVLRNGLSIHDETNLVTACYRCNCGRADRIKCHKYATQGAKDRIQRVRRRSLKPYLRLAKSILAGEIPADVAITEARRA